MFKSFVTNALDQKAQGNMTQYSELTAAFAVSMPPRGDRGDDDDDDDDDGDDAGDGERRASQLYATSFMASPSTLQSWLVALSEQVSKLDSTHTALVDNILLLPWTTMSESFARAWMNFVHHLISARGEWLYPVVQRAVKTLSYRTDWRALALAESSRRTGATDAAGPQGMATRRMIYDRTHGLLRRLLHVVPTMTFCLEAVLRNYFPPKRESAIVQLTYIRNALRVCEYCPELSDSVLNLVIGRALQTDVEIQVELDELEEEGAERTGAAFDNDSDDDPLDLAIDQVHRDDSDADDDDDEDAADGNESDEVSGDEDISSGDEEGAEAESDTNELEEPSAESLARVRKLVDQLDAIMKVILDHLNRMNRLLGEQANSSAYLSDPIGRDPRHALFACLLSIFSRSILPTFKSRHVQFLLFWLTSLDPDYVDLFLGSLLSTALHWGLPSQSDTQAVSDEPPIIRLAAASYAASFVSRAQFVHAPICRDVMTNLCAFLEGHLIEASTPGSPLFHAPPGSPAHHPFYSVSQAAFYIFCFRWRDLRCENGASMGSGALDGAGMYGTSFQSASSPSSPPEPATGFSLSSMGSMAEAAASMGAGTSGVDLPIGAQALPKAELAQSAGAAGPARGGTWMEPLSVLTRAITSPLNPLRYCAPAIVHQFAHVAQYARFFYCFSLLEANKRLALRDPETQAQAGTGSRETASMGLTDAFFPFDPFRLPKAGRYVEPLYREWADVAPEELEEDEDEDEEEEEEEESGAASGSDKHTSGSVAGMSTTSRSSPVDVPQGQNRSDKEKRSSQELDLDAMSIESH